MKKLYQSLCVWATLLLPALVHGQVPVLNSYPSATAVVFLDFDGHLVQGTSWNYAGPIPCGASGLSATKVNEVFHRVAEDFRPFNINITTDSTVFLAAPLSQRVRVIMTVSSSWYGSAGGVSFVGSFSWGDDTPAFVFTALHNYRVKDIAEATSHEAGHTLGLYHQSKYDASCNKLADYYSGQGTGEIGWAPIMGVGYSKNFTLWNYGPNSFGCASMQSDLDIITSNANGFGYRADDHGSDFTSATQPVFANQEFEVAGVIERNTDHDMFRFIMPGSGRFELDAVPYNVGSGNAGSDLDMQVTLYDQYQSPLSVYNPGALLNSVADTTLGAGTYYLKVEGKGNLYAPAYASLGSYSMHGRISLDGGEVLPLHKLLLKGQASGDKHLLNWVIEADEKIETQTLERSIDGRNFVALSEEDSNSRSYVYRPGSSGSIAYRVNVSFVNGRRYYSNTVNIKEEDLAARPALISTLIHSNTVSIKSPGNFAYQVLDLNGRVLAKGQLTSGNNHIEINGLINGLYLVRFSGNGQQWTDKLMRQ